MKRTIAVLGGDMRQVWLTRLLLEDGLIDFLTLILSHLTCGLNLILEFLNVYGFTVDFSHGRSGAEEGSARSKEVTDDESQQGHTDDDEQKH